MQQDLFGNTNSQKLIKTKTTKAPVSKEQLAFNKLTTRIHNLQKQIEITEIQLQNLNTYYSTQVKPQIIALANAKVTLAHTLHKNRTLIKLSKLQNTDLDFCIYSILEDAFGAIIPSEADKDLYNQYNEESTYEQEIEDEETEAKAYVKEMLKAQFGVDVNLDNVSDMADFETIQQQIQEQLTQSANNQEQNTKPRKKSKKQEQKEELIQKKEALKTKNLRSIYLSLAKILHPDAVTDQDSKIEKEEMMKKVTVAYNDKNLMELLKLEMQWVQNHTQQVDKDTLNVYAELLKDQIKNLEEELQMIFYNPKYMEISDYPLQNPNYAQQLINNDKKSFEALELFAKQNIEALNAKQNIKQVIKECIETFVEVEDEEEIDFDVLMQMMLNKR